jgi:hypothetical protein
MINDNRYSRIPEVSPMGAQELVATAKAMVAEGKGLLAMDKVPPPVTSVLKKWGFLKPRKRAALTGK